jgi:hypothetical protein
MVDAISLSTVATYDIQVAFSIELRALLRESHSLGSIVARAWGGVPAAVVRYHSRKA